MGADVASRLFFLPSVIMPASKQPVAMDNFSSLVTSCPRRRSLIGGVLQNPVTKKYQVWFLPIGKDVESLRAFDTPQRADQCYQTLRNAFASGSGDVIERTFLAVSSDGHPPHSFPGETLQRLREGLRTALRARGITLTFPSDAASDVQPVA
jgi:hypothetical protein